MNYLLAPQIFNSKVKIIRPFNYLVQNNLLEVIPNIIFQLLNKKIKYVKLGNIYPRERLYVVNDLCEAYFKILNLKKYGEIFNVATAINYSIEDIYNKISKIIGIRKKLRLKILENVNLVVKLYL